MLIAAVWIAAIPLVGKYIIIGISGLLVLTVNHNFLVLAAFFTCMIIFVFPLFLLGTVTPSLVKYTVDSLDNSGKIVGTLGAFNTIGSIIGTFIPTFVTIPAVGTSVTFLIFSGILLLLSFVYFLPGKKKVMKCMMAFLIFCLCSIFGYSDSFAFWEHNLTYEGESIYNYLQVKETKNSVILSTNVLFGVQSITKKDHSLTGLYYDYAMAAPVLAGVKEKDAANVLILGMGTGTYARQCKNYFPNLQIEGVEIDQKITDLANQYFDAAKDVHVTTYDGRAYLQAVDKKYDVILVDAYQDITIPFQMSTKEFFQMVKEHLTDRGVMVVNMNMHAKGAGNINEYLSDTIAHVFHSVYTVDVNGSTNRELFATGQSGNVENFENQISQIKSQELKSLMNQIAENMSPYQKGNDILTDDKAPVELLGMKVIDQLIQEEIGYYKQIFHEKGISGLLEQGI
jgi:spermidine synthase